MITLSKELVLRLHAKLIEVTGGSPGLRDDGLLQSALSSPFHSFGGEINNHAFVDGNKRIGTYMIIELLDLNHISYDFFVEDVVRIGFEVASGTMSHDDLFELLLEHTQ